jgi:hypothetical protein
LVKTSPLLRHQKHIVKVSPSLITVGSIPDTPFPVKIKLLKSIPYPAPFSTPFRAFSANFPANIPRADPDRAGIKNGKNRRLPPVRRIGHPAPSALCPKIRLRRGENKSPQKPRRRITPAR